MSNDEADDEIQGPPRVVYVNAYAVSQLYGGPEEGGWWYDAGTPLASIPVIVPDDWVGNQDHDDINAAKEQLKAAIGWVSKHPGRYSVIGGDDFEIYVENEMAQPFPSERPHYE